MGTTRQHKGDIAHHHPRVRRTRSAWVWACDCGGASCRTAMVGATWREAVIGALYHAACLAP